MEATQLELLRDQISTDELAQMLVGAIKSSPELQRAILEVVWACPNVMTRA